jgi:glyceraldehyde-3-phosphate dehydrogenase type I
MKRIAINGFGRIGRPLFRSLLKKKDIGVVAINDLTDTKTLAHLLKYDSVYGIYDKAVQAKEGSLVVDGKEFQVLAEPEPAKLPWKELGIDIVLECTGRFSYYEGAKGHLGAGAKKVIVSAPCKGSPKKVPSFILGVNADQFDPKKHDVIDMASCTTNCLAPVAKVLNENFKIVHGFMSTIHAYTSTQRILDLPHKDLRRARAAALNIIPTTTGAAKAIGQVMPELEGKLDAMSYRVPIPTVSIIDLICQVENEIDAEEINYSFKKASKTKELKGILGIEDAHLVSTDYIGNSFSAIVDADSTRALGKLIKVVAWYDNEFAYANRLADFTEFVAKKL